MDEVQLFRSAADHQAVVSDPANLNFELHIWFRPILHNCALADWDAATMTDRLRQIIRNATYNMGLMGLSLHRARQFPVSWCVTVCRRVPSPSAASWRSAERRRTSRKRLLKLILESDPYRPYETARREASSGILFAFITPWG